MESPFRRLDKYVYNISIKRANQIVKPLLPWLQSSKEPVLDFGSGLGHIGYIISQSTGRKVTYLDVRKYPFTCPNVIVEIFDGKVIPFPDVEFDTTVIFLVLHHTPNPKSSLEEILRVSKNRIMVCEDLLVSRKHIISEAIKDTITNGFLPHMTFQYKTESEWEDLFGDLGLTIKGKIYHESKFIFEFKHVSWLLGVNSPTTTCRLTEVSSGK